jgi:serine/threonine-protein kinase
LTPRPGNTLAGGRYQLIRELGAGGNGVVWLAMHRGMNAETVVKFPKEWSQTSSVSHVQLQQEARALAAFSSRHPNIVNILDVGEVHGRPFVVMQFMRQGSLSDYCAGGPRAHEAGNLRQSLHWFRMIADALDFVHRADLIHRDVKPANVLLDDSYSAYLADFGLASMMLANESRDRPAGGLFGSLAYMAPELLRGQQARPESDQFALAVTVYEFIVGAVPFEGASVAEIVSSQEKNWKRWQLTPPSQLAPALWSVVAQALHPLVDSRYENCARFANLLCDAWDGSTSDTAARARTPTADTQDVPDETVDIGQREELAERKPPPAPPTPARVEPARGRTIKLRNVLGGFDDPAPGSQ